METNYTEKIIELWQETNLNQSKIAKEVGCTRSHVSYVLDKHDVKQKHSRPPKKSSFNVKDIEGLTDEEIAHKFNISLGLAAKKRKRLGLSKVRIINLSRRRDGLCKTLFGYLAGPEFTNYFVKKIENLTERQKSVILNFYITPKLEFLSENINTDSTRVYLDGVRKILKKKLSGENLEELLERGVIRNG